MCFEDVFIREIHIHSLEFEAKKTLFAHSEDVGSIYICPVDDDGLRCGGWPSERVLLEQLACGSRNASSGRSSRASGI